jgi:FkbM family methyltransferase
MFHNGLKRFAWSMARALGRPVCKKCCGRTDPIDDMRRLAHFLQPGAILDVGAHVGAVSTRLAKVIPNVPIHAFEPTPATAGLLRHAARSEPRITVHEVALSAQSGPLNLFVNRNEQTNSLLDNDTANTKYLQHATAHERNISIHGMRLDDWADTQGLKTPLFIKADIQGAELMLIEGGESTLRNSTAIFFSEVSLAPLYKGAGDLFQIHAALTGSLPFVLLDVYRTFRSPSGRALWCDAMWIHRDFLSRIEPQAK